MAKPLLLRPELAEAAKHIPLDRIVLETDSYPQPWKKNPARRTEPSHLPLVAEKLAELKGVGVADIEAATTANLKRALRLALIGGGPRYPAPGRSASSGVSSRLAHSPIDAS